MSYPTSNTAQNAFSRPQRRSKIGFPPLPSPELIRSTLRSYFAHSKSPVYAVLDVAGEIRCWSVRKSAANTWGHRYLWDPFKVVELNAELSQFAVRS